MARHGQQHSPSAGSQLFKLVVIALAVVLVSGLGVVGYVVTSWTSTVSANAVDLDGQKELPPDIAAYKGGFDILLAGVDTCEAKYKDLFGERCTGQDANGTLNDVNLLLHVSADHQNATVLSLPRDLMVPFPSCPGPNGEPDYFPPMSEQQLNSAMMYGGLPCVAPAGSGHCCGAASSIA